MNLFLLLLFLITVAYLIIISAFSIGWFLIKYYHTSGKEPVTKVSIIVPARNEELNIENCLNDLIKQEYPKELFEIIVINDASTDKTKEKIESFINSCSLLLTPYPNITLLESSAPLKKAAITLGVNHATGDLIITTDADCRMGSKWLSTLVDYYEINKPKMMIAPVCMKNENTLFKKLQSIEFLSLIASSAGACKLRIPLMCNGANLVYEKEAFNEADGFNTDMKYSSGDDVFLMNKISKKYPSKVHFIKNKDVIVCTDAKENISKLISQRKRWVSKIAGSYSFIVARTTNNYKLSTISTALVVYLFNLSLLILFILWLFSLVLSFKFLVFSFTLFSYLFICKSLIDYPILSGITSFMNKKYFFRYFLPLEFINILYVSVIGIIGSISTYEWKGRTKLH